MTYPLITTLPMRPDRAPLLKTVESMGCSCELGFVQRQCKVEPLSLLRFAFAPLDGLVDALQSGFAGIADHDQLAVKATKLGVWMIHHKRYKFEFHAEKPVQNAPAEQIREATATHVEFLAGVLMEKLQEGEKLFVYRPKQPSAPGADRQKLLNAMQRYGKPQLLWLDIPEDPAKQGTAEWVEQGRLIAGYVDRFAEPSTTVNFELWLRVIQAATELRQAAGLAQPVRLQRRA